MLLILDFYFGIIKVKETKAICLNFYEILWGFSLMKNTNLVYGVKDNPGFLKTIVFALQQVLAILAATIVVPVIINTNNDLNAAGVFPQMSQSAALFGAGVGTLVYLLFTKFRSPVFLGSSFAFIGSMCAAFAGAASVSVGYIGLIIGTVMAGLVYVIIALIVKYAGVKWIDKVMPASVIGPTVAIIGLSLSGNAVGDLTKGLSCSPWIALLCGLTTLATVIVCSVYGKKMMKMIPFIIGVLALVTFSLLSSPLSVLLLEHLHLWLLTSLSLLIWYGFLNLPSLPRLKVLLT